MFFGYSSLQISRQRWKPRCTRSLWVFCSVLQAACNLSLQTAVGFLAYFSECSFWCSFSSLPLSFSFMPLSVLYLHVKVLLSLLAAHTIFHALMSNRPFSEVEDNILEVDAKLVVPLCLIKRLLLPLLIIAVTLTAGSLKRGLYLQDWHVTVNLTTAVANTVTT